MQFHSNLICNKFKTNYYEVSIFINSVSTYFENSLPISTEWQLSVWKANEKPRQMMAPAKKAPNIIFSCICISTDGRDKKYSATPMNATQPSKCVQILPVSVCTRNIDLKQALNEGSGGRWPRCRKSLSCNHLGKFL